MNVRLTKTWQWQSGTVQYDTFFINSYSARIQMYTTGMDATEHATAYERMDHWFSEVMQDSVMISVDYAKLKHYAQTGQRLLVFPEDPVDQLVGIMLCLKLNAITEGRLIITDVDLGSINGADMVYRHNHSEACGPLSSPGWWTDPRPNWASASSRGAPGKVVSLSRTPEWNTLELDWTSSHDNKQSAVVFADFDRDEDQ